MKRRVLIVSPNFPPINAPDHQRVRMALPFFSDFGWIADILAVNKDCNEGVFDPFLSQTLPEDLQIFTSKALPLKYTRWFGLGNMAYRSLPYLLKAGSKLLNTGKFDLVFFSTSMFPVMALGQYWYNNHGVPYVLDFQDPWITDYYDNENTPEPPGGQIKYGLNKIVAKFMEPYAVKNVAHIITVSPSYPEMLQKRYSWLKNEQFTVMPFCAAEQDFKCLSDLKLSQSFFNRDDGNTHWVYVGCVGKIMDFSIRSFFTALKIAQEREPVKWSNLRLHFIGTDYAPGDRARKTVETVAVECGIGNIVHEHPHRVPYFVALQCLMDADALIVPGSDDPGYTASKIYPYILAKKPLLAIFHEQSSVVDVLHLTKAGIVITFATGESIEVLADRISDAWFTQSNKQTPETNWQAFAPFTAREMTRRLCQCFNKCINKKKRAKL